MPLKSFCSGCSEPMSRMYVRTTNSHGPYFTQDDYDKSRQQPHHSGGMWKDKRRFKPIGWYCVKCSRFVIDAELKFKGREYGQRTIVNTGTNECHYDPRSYYYRVHHGSVFGIYMRSRNTYRGMVRIGDYCDRCGMFTVNAFWASVIYSILSQRTWTSALRREKKRC